MAGYRGRLIFAFKAGIARLDPDAARAAGSYDETFREPRIGTDGEKRRHEMAVIQVPCQVEHEYQKHSSELRPEPAGNTPRSRLRLVFHYKDLERMGLVDAETKRPLIRVGDRLDAIYEKDGTLVETIQTPPGLYCVEAQSHGYGFSTKRNLLVCTFDDRVVAAEQPAGL